MGIMSAGVHQVALPRAIGDRFFVLQPQGINVRAECDEFPCLAAFCIDNQTAAIRSHPVLNIQVAELIGNVGSRLDFLATWLGVCMQVASHFPDPGTVFKDICIQFLKKWI